MAAARKSRNCSRLFFFFFFSSISVFLHISFSPYIVTRRVQQTNGESVRCTWCIIKVRHESGGTFLPTREVVDVSSSCRKASPRPRARSVSSSNESRLFLLLLLFFASSFPSPLEDPVSLPLSIFLSVSHSHRVFSSVRDPRVVSLEETHVHLAFST